MKTSKKKGKIVTQPYLKGKMLDRSTWKDSLRFLVSYAVLGLITFLLASGVVGDSSFIRILLCGALEVLFLFVFFTLGAGKGTDTVKVSEIMYDRKDSGRFLTKQEENGCYHPLKGLLHALIGTLPLLIAAIILALVAKRQIIGFGSLPAWVTETGNVRPELVQPLSYYFVADQMGLESVLRMIIRLTIIPWVGLFDPANASAMLLLEKLSPLMILLGPAAYGVGYLQGPARRTALHSKIAENNRKRARKEKKRLQEKQRNERKKIELN